MAQLKLDLIDGHDAELTEKGWTCTRQAIVEGVTGTDGEKIANAVAVDGMPSIGNAHPNLAGTWLQRIRVKEIEGNIVKIELYYAASESINEHEYEIGASASQVETNLDRLGDELYVGYTFPEDYINPTYQNYVDIQGVTFSKYIPEGTIRISKQEGITKLTLLNRVRDYVNKVNNAGWSLDSNAPAGSWLCTEIRGRKANTDLMVVSYSFLKRPPFIRNGTTYPGWSQQLVYIDPNTGKPPPPETWTNETFKVIMPYEYVNFNSLGLGWL